MLLLDRRLLVGNYVNLIVVVVVSLLRMCRTYKHIQSHIKHSNEIKDLIKTKNTERAIV